MFFSVRGFARGGGGGETQLRGGGGGGGGGGKSQVSPLLYQTLNGYRGTSVVRLCSVHTEGD